MQTREGETRRAVRAAWRRVVVAACRTYLGAGMERNRFRTSSTALAVVVTAAGAALGAAGAVVAGAPVPDGAVAGIAAVTAPVAVAVLVMLLIAAVLHRTGRSPAALLDPRVRPRPAPPSVVHELSPGPAEPVVPLSVPAFFLLVGLLLGAEGLWGAGDTAYLWAAASCLTTSALAATWRATSRRA